MTKGKKTTIINTLYRKLKIEQHEPHWKPVVNSKCHIWIRDCLLVRSTWVHHRFVTRITRQVPHMEQGLPTRPEYMSSPPVFSGVHVARSLVFCIVFWWSLSFFLWSLCCLTIFNLRFLITSLVSSTFS
jgi:hypothetical protein